MSFANSGRSWDRAELRGYLDTLTRPAWAKGVTFHHTAVPSLGHASWGQGWNSRLIANMRDGYIAKGWRSGPHFYPDDKEIWGLTPPTVRGVHARSFNSSHIGIEVLGDYDVEDHLSGRGWQCWQHAFECAAELLQWLNQPLSAINFHRDDPLTSKSCPGTRIGKDWVINGVWSMLSKFHVEPVEQLHGERVVISEWLRANGILAPIYKAGTQVMVGGKWIESAQYDGALKATTALEQELEQDLKTP